ncbi:hypothetical protein KW787_00240 [Candidatus Pacearchaeota archaeon]|nr:hypothetical protein [Candidatus Pacearchaeota archaeon]
MKYTLDEKLENLQKAGIRIAEVTTPSIIAMSVKETGRNAVYIAPNIKRGDEVDIALSYHPPRNNLDKRVRKIEIGVEPYVHVELTSGSYYIFRSRKKVDSMTERLFDHAGKTFQLAELFKQ